MRLRAIRSPWSRRLRADSVLYCRSRVPTVVVAFRRRLPVVVALVLDKCSSIRRDFGLVVSVAVEVCALRAPQARRRSGLVVAAVHWSAVALF